MKVFSVLFISLILAVNSHGGISSQTDAIDAGALIESILYIDEQQAEQIKDLVLDAEYIEGEMNDRGEFEQKVRILKKIYIKYLPDTALMYERYLKLYKEGKLQDEETTQKEARERLEKKRKRKSQDISWSLLTPFREGNRDLYDIVYVGVPDEKIEGKSCHYFRVTAIEKDPRLINGDYYFDAESLHLVRVDFSPSKLASNLMFKMKQLDMSIIFAPNPDGYWLPKQFDISGRGKAMFLIGVKFAGTEYYSNGQINSGVDDSLFEN